MDVIIDDEMLERFVLYEHYIYELFEQASHSRWFGMSANVVQEYERVKLLRKHVSILVDMAFTIYGIKNKFMKDRYNNLIKDFLDDFEALAYQLMKIDCIVSSSSTPLKIVNVL
ncbi:MAG: hypothetical protein AB7D06_11840 [Pedobacter sp.]